MSENDKSFHSKSSKMGSKVESILPLPEIFPSHICLLPVTQTTFFPGMIVPMVLPEGRLAKASVSFGEESPWIGVVLTRKGEEGATAAIAATSIHTFPNEAFNQQEGEVGNYAKYGILAKVLKKINLPENQVSLLLSGQQRFEILKLKTEDSLVTAEVRYLEDKLTQDDELEALLRSAVVQFKQLAKDNPLISEEVKVALVNIDGPGRLADFIASVLIKEMSDYQRFLSMVSVKQRLEQVLVLIKKELAVQAVQKKIQEDINQKVSSAQREFYLNEQLKTIQKELGKFSEDRYKTIQRFKDRLETKLIPVASQDRIKDELERLEVLNEQSAEYSVAYNYLDWLTAMPWGTQSQEKTDLTKALKLLNEEHYGLKEAKERILEFLAVRKMNPESKGAILCFVGPPGTGKTSLGSSIAKVLGRKFYRFSVGGMRDEAEIKGHRRTYVGALPGKLIQGLKRTGVDNPVFMIDEIDKLGTSWTQGGDPSSALLEALDPEQNAEFLDHYLDMPYDCSKVLFLATANSVDTIPSPLLDRMECIYLSGYTDSEKIQIATKHLLPKVLKKNALDSRKFKIADACLKTLVREYARESGVRNLEKQLDKLARKTILKIARKRVEALAFETPKDLEKYLGPAFYPKNRWTKNPKPGIATGLAWTASGGEVLRVESLVTDGKGGLVLTGALGKVMQESANIALTLVRSFTKEMKLSKKFFDKHQIHLHVPCGATPKDGPSAGVTMALSLYSLLSGKKLNPKIAMTGELTLSGQILPVGGIKEKLLAAYREGIEEVLIPLENKKDLREVEREILLKIKVRPLETFEQYKNSSF